MRPAFRRLTLSSAPLPSHRTLSTSLPRFAVAAAATSPSSSSAAAPKARVYAKRVATSTTSTPTRAAPRSTSTTASKPSSTTRSAPATAPPLTADDLSFDDFSAIEDDHSLPDISAGIDDYANLAPPPAVVRRARLPASSSAASIDQPTPSPPLSSLPAGVSTLPIISSRQPDIQGEQPVGLAPGENGELDWSTTFAGLGQRPFDKEVGEALLRPLDPKDVEVKPDGLLYLPEIKYRRTLNAAFGPGGWGLAPRGETNVGPRIVSREWGLIAMGRLVSVARGEQEYFDPSGVPTATEACKSNALMRCCKDLGIASELWDPRFIREFKTKYCAEVFTEHMGTKRKKKMWRKKDAKFEYPYKEG